MQTVFIVVQFIEKLEAIRDEELAKREQIRLERLAQEEQRILELQQQMNQEAGSSAVDAPSPERVEMTVEGESSNKKRKRPQVLC